MDTGRDLGRADLWEQSLERSRARRARARRRRIEARRSVAGFGGVSATVALLAVTLPSLWESRNAAGHQTRMAFRLSSDPQQLPGLQPRPPAHFVTVRSHAARHAVRSKTPVHPVLLASTTTSPATVTTVTHTSPVKTTPKPTVTHHPDSVRATVAKEKHPDTTRHTTTPAHHQSAPTHHATPKPSPPHHQSPPTPAPQGYVNPLAHASVTPERIDQGVDYAGSGPLDALGDGQITYVGTSNTGWPGAFIEFRLLNGPDSGRYVYYAEDVTPAQGLHVGQTVSAGQAIATIYQGSDGIEIGWGAGVGTETYAAAHGQWSPSDDADSVPTPSGESFSALIASLGGPPGKVEG
jgi:hypothetical protein